MKFLFFIFYFFKNENNIRGIVRSIPLTIAPIPIPTSTMLIKPCLRSNLVWYLIVNIIFWVGSRYILGDKKISSALMEPVSTTWTFFYSSPCFLVTFREILLKVETNQRGEPCFWNVSKHICLLYFILLV